MKISEFTVSKASNDSMLPTPFKLQNKNKFSRTNTNYSETGLKQPLKNRQKKSKSHVVS